MFKEDDKPLKRIKNLSSLISKQIWEYDKKKIEFLNSKNITTIIIWEKDYLSNKVQTVNFCLEEIRKKILQYN